MMEIAHEVCPGFVLDEELKPAMNDVFFWCLMQPGRLDPAKGLLLYGGVGSGKTTMLEVIRRMCGEVRPVDHFGRPYTFRITRCIDVAAEFAEKGYAGIQTYTNADHQAFDDLGCEPLKMNHYGTFLNVMEYIIQSRYRKDYHLTMMTTNLTVGEMQSFYGVRALDRLGEMMNIVKWDTMSFRPEFPT